MIVDTIVINTFSSIFFVCCYLFTGLVVFIDIKTKMQPEIKIVAFLAWSFFFDKEVIRKKY